MIKKIKLSVIFVVVFLMLTTIVKAEDCESTTCDENSEQYFDCIKDKKICLENKLEELGNKKITLSNTISVINGNINIQELQIKQRIAEINQLEKEIENLGNRISGLNISLDRLTTLLVDRIRAQYKQERTNPLATLIVSKSITKIISQSRYLSLAGKQTAEAMQRAQNQRVLYDEQKDIKIIKQNEVETKRYQLQLEQNNLVDQRTEQQHFLNITNNDEAKFQSLLKSVQSEFEAIQAIISKRKSDTEVRHVDAGDKIASVIQGASCNSGGTHLHYTITKDDGSTVNPFEYLKSIDHNNCSGPGSCSPGDNFNPSGNWDWPISATIKFTQGYGSTWATRNTWVGQIYNFHNGIDISSTSSSEVKSTQPGTLYRGSYTGTAGCRLKYVRVDHDNDGLTSYYLHVNY